MINFFYSLLFFFFINFSASADVIKNLFVEGNNRISIETIKVYGEIELDKNYDQNIVDDILKKLYLTNFFEDISISLKGDTMQIFVKEYPVLNSVDLIGEKSNTIKKSILERLSLKSKESFIESYVQNDINLLKKIYGSLGFNFPNIDANVQKFPNNRVNVVYNVDKGKRTYIKKINFIGDKKVKEKRLRDIIASEEKKFWKFLSKNTYFNLNTIELDKRLLENYYKSIGYYDVQVLSNNAEVSNENETIISYTINAGNRYKITKIRTNLSDVLDKNIFSSLENSYKEIIGKYYSPFKITKLLQELDLIIANNDLQFIEHSVNEVLSEDTVEVVINVFEGSKQLVERVDVVGNTVTNEAVIRSELLIDEGDPFNNLRLNQSISRLKSRNLFAEVNSKIIDGNQKNQKIIEISVEEKPTGEISAGAGVGTSGGSFAFNISENNWLGEGISLSSYFDLSSSSASGGINVSNPNYNFSGNSLNFFINNTKNDQSESGWENNILSSGIGTKFEQYKNIFLSPTLKFSYDDLKVDSSATNSLQKQKGTFSELAFDYGITLDNRDRAYNPTDGFISTFSQELPLYADSPSLENTYQLSSYHSLSQNIIGSFKFYLSSVTGISNKDVRLSKRARLPSSRLRGFEQGKVGPKDGTDFIGGNYAAATNFEMNLPNLLPESTKTDISLFLDLGNLWSVDYDSSLDDSNKIRSSAGITTNWLSPVGPMSFIFSQNISKASTDITESFNFRLGTTF